MCSSLLQFYNATSVDYPCGMSPYSTPLLTRLRRHRGLWALAMAVLMIKLVAGTVCLTDGPGSAVAARSTVAASASGVMDVAASAAAADDVGDCLLGEAGDCHCACAHTMPMPATAPLCIARVAAHFTSPAVHAGFAAAMTGSLLRPPIA